MKSFFKSYTYTWQQIGIFKFSLLAMGAVAGAYWHEFFGSVIEILIVVAVAGSAYTMYISLKQK